jgi:hypothetical protein
LLHFAGKAFERREVLDWHVFADSIWFHVSKISCVEAVLALQIGTALYLHKTNDQLIWQRNSIVLFAPSQEAFLGVGINWLIPCIQQTSPWDCRKNMN